MVLAFAVASVDTVDDALAFPGSATPTVSREGKLRADASPCCCRCSPAAVAAAEKAACKDPAPAPPVALPVCCRNSSRPANFPCPCSSLSPWPWSLRDTEVPSTPTLCSFPPSSLPPLSSPCTATPPPPHPALPLASTPPPPPPPPVLPRLPHCLGRRRNSSSGLGWSRRSRQGLGGEGCRSLGWSATSKDDKKSR